jgi:hypothetical protein
MVPVGPGRRSATLGPLSCSASSFSRWSGASLRWFRIGTFTSPSPRGTTLSLPPFSAPFALSAVQAVSLPRYAEQPNFTTPASLAI